MSVLLEYGGFIKGIKDLIYRRQYDEAAERLTVLDTEELCNKG